MGNALTNNPDTDPSLASTQEWLLGDMADAIFGGSKPFVGLVPETASNLVSKENSKKESTNNDSSESKKKSSKKKKSSDSKESESSDDN